MLIEEIKAIIDTYPNFPREGIMFKDLNPILREPNLFLELINKMSEDIFLREADCIIGIDARGFIFASCIALKLSKPLVLARKPGKLPGKLIEKSYDLEYGSNTLCIQKKSIRSYKHKRTSTKSRKRSTTVDEKSMRNQNKTNGDQKRSTKVANVY